jgi:CheY-like chemotaxis protein
MPVDIGALLHEVMVLMQPLAKRKQLDLTLELDPAAPTWVRGDAMRIKQILLNLCGNAIKFTERGGVRLALRAAQAPFTVQFAICDSGPGLNAEQQTKLFQRFNQVDGALTALRHGGSGLGLSICRELAALMGGRIDVDSSPGAGSEFRVSLPLLPATPAALVLDAQAHAARARPAVAGRARRILLVEDDSTVATVVSELLQQQGHTVRRVADGLAALTELAQAHFDLALLDLDLPGIDGFELARLIRAQGHSLPLVTLTARSDADAEPLSRAAGMAAFLRKPVTGSDLSRLLDSLDADTPD